MASAGHAVAYASDRLSPDLQGAKRDGLTPSHTVGQCEAKRLQPPYQGTMFGFELGIDPAGLRGATPAPADADARFLVAPERRAAGSARRGDQEAGFGQRAHRVSMSVYGDPHPRLP